MQSKRWRTVMWVLGSVLAVVLVAVAGLQMAISRNGPAVLNAVDRITGGGRDVVSTMPVQFGEHSGQKLVVHSPNSDADDPLPVLLFVHGGSWRNGDPVDYDFVGRAFVPEGFVVVLAGYRMFPDAVFPAMLEDTASAVAWIKQNIADHGGDPDRIVLSGHSAGAYNVVMTALDDKWLLQEGLAQSDIAGVVGLSGPYDFYPFDSDSTINSFGDAASPQDTQPVNFTGAGAPPMLLLHGDADTVVKPRNSLELAKRLKQAGAKAETHIYPDFQHRDPLMLLASPWRGRDNLHQRMVDFAKAAGTK
ncbi:MAG: alpha/beta hydrolase [Erythrobacter sp.]